jgi:hypothetical protein
MTPMFDTVLDFLTADGWPFTASPDRPVVRTGYKGDHGNWTCYGHVDETNGYFIFYSVCPVNVPPENRLTMAEFLARANYGLPVGNFELDFSDGEIRYKTSLDAEDERLSEVLVRNLIYANVFTADRYLPGIMRVIYNAATPQEAIIHVETALNQPEDASG